MPTWRSSAIRTSTWRRRAGTTGATGISTFRKRSPSTPGICGWRRSNDRLPIRSGESRRADLSDQTRIPSTPSPDPARGALVERLDRLYPAVVADVLDRMGYREQAMAPDIRPLFPEARLCGTAMPVLAVPSYSVPETDPYKLELEAVDRLRPGDVMVVSHIDASFWGELL